MKTLLHIAIIACVACACQEQKPQGYTGNNTIIFYTDNLEDAIDELGDEYTEEEIRLVRIKFISDMAN